MELWNDYEGKVLDGQYRLERLIGPKGRSAFFTTNDANGSAATIRVIESLNDEDEILTRWNAVRAINDPNLLQILACNKTVLDGVHLVYAVLEPTDAVLADLLRERALTPDEARDVAATVAGGLEALHTRRLVHEHVDAESVFAVGETVKLRGDCVRETPEGAEGETLLRRDAHDLAMLVGYSLTQRRDSGQVKLPRPWDDFVKNGMTGTWGLREMANAVRPLTPKVTAPAKPAVEAKVAAAESPATKIVATDAPKAIDAKPAAALPADQQKPRAAAAGSSARAAAESLGTGAANASTPVPMRRSAAEDRIVLEPEEQTPARTGVWAGVAAGIALAIALIWHFAGGSGAKTEASSGQPARSVATASMVPTPTSTTPAPLPAKPSAATLPATRASKRAAAPLMAAATSAPAMPVEHGAGPAGSQWRLVAFTYNREEQAQRKAAEIGQSHPDLKPEVFTPSGRAPYLVALGGWMSSDQANALKQKARGQGLPRDTYTQNFRGR